MKTRSPRDSARVIAGSRARERLVDHPLGGRPVLEPVGLDRVALQVLVHLEEVLDLVQERLGNAAQIAPTCDHIGSRSGTQRIFSSSPFSSVIRNSPIGPHADPAAREGRLADEHERVERIAVASEGPVDVAVVGGVLHRGEEHPVEVDLAAVVVELVLVARPLRDLDHHREDLGRHPRSVATPERSRGGGSMARHGRHHRSGSSASSCP